MTDDELGPSAPIVSVRSGRNQLAEEPHAVLEERRRRAKDAEAHRKGMKFGDHKNRDAAPHLEEPHDDILILGIPRAEMTPNVRHAIEQLLDEISQLHAEVLRIQGREAYLEKQAQNDCLLHVIRRQTFLARLNLAARKVEQEQVQFSFVYIKIMNVEEVRTRLGHDASENLMVQAAETLRESASRGDVLGSLEQHDFGVLLPGTPFLRAQEKGGLLAKSLRGRSFVWRAQVLELEVAFGVAEVAPQDKGEDVIERAVRACSECRPTRA